jgi:prepilin peptidase CpaA
VVREGIKQSQRRERQAMNLFATSPEWIVWLLVSLLAAATIQDAVQLRISNIISGSVLILAMVAMVMSGFQASVWQNAVIFAVVLTIGTLLFSRNILGGGDVKLFAAVALWVDFASALQLIASILIAGGILAIIIITLRLLAPKKLTSRVKTLQPRAGIPYGIAIAAGTLLVLALPGPSETQVPYAPIHLPIQVR